MTKNRPFKIGDTVRIVRTGHPDVEPLVGRFTTILALEGSMYTTSLVTSSNYLKQARTGTAIVLGSEIEHVRNYYDYEI